MRCAYGGSEIVAATDDIIRLFKSLMGWNSCNTFACDIDEQLIKQTADIMVSSGMRDAGYQYINLDDCWHGERDTDGSFTLTPSAFLQG